MVPSISTFTFLQIDNFCGRLAEDIGNHSVVVCALLVIDMQNYFLPVASPIIGNVFGHQDIEKDGGMLLKWWYSKVQVLQECFGMESKEMQNDLDSNT